MKAAGDPVFFTVRLLSAILLMLLPSSPGLCAGNAYLDELTAKAGAMRLSEDRMWLLLLHYRRSWSGAYESQAAEDTRFFLAHNGKRDPRAELEATLKAFFEPIPADPEEQHPRCRFPARYAWLKENLAFDARVPDPPCPRFAEWREAVDPAGVTLVFADAYLNNPSSMYGHTFLRMNLRGAKEGQALLDYTVNFAGVADTRNTVLYALRGLTGSFQGKFSSLPYYMKIQEYTNLESRDLWEYSLNLTQEQIDRMAMHVWELGSTYFPYYFFKENCSYQLLPLLEIADPSLHLTDGFKAWAIPADTVRAVLRQKGLVRSVRYRPSQATLMLARRRLLSKEETDLATDLGDPSSALKEKTSPAPPEALSALAPDRRALTLDSAYDYFRYRAGFSPDESPETKRMERNLLLLRGQTGVPPSPPPAFPEAHPLEEGHDTGRLSLGGGVSDKSVFEEVSWRPALHDLSDAAAGYVPDSQLEMANVVLRFNNRERDLFPERLDLVRIVSLSPWDRWIRKPSWDFDAGVFQAKELDCEGWSCAYYGMNGGAGLSVEIYPGMKAVGYAIAESDGGLGPVFRRDWRWGGGGRAGILLEPAGFWRVQAEGTYYRYLNADDGPHEELRVVNSFALTKDLSLRVSLVRQVPAREIDMGAYLYY